MDQKQNDELNMLEDIFSVLEQNVLKITPIPDLLQGKVDLGNFITDLHENINVQDADQTGVAGNKSKQKEKVIKSILKLSGALLNLGRKTNNDQLIQQFGFAPSHPGTLRDNDLVTLATNTATAANTNIAALAAGGILPADVTALNSQNLLLTTMLSTPETAKELKIVAGNNIVKTFTVGTRPLIKQTLKTLMSSNFQETDHDFWNLFEEATVRNTTGVHHFDLYGNVTDKVTSALLNGATLKIFEGTNLITTVRTAEKGNYHIKTLPEGSYSAEISRPGYVTETFNNINKITGQSIKLNFKIAAV